MARLLLSESDDWALSFPKEHDVRGYEAVDESGNPTGRRVRDLVLDPDAERVGALLLDDGTESPAADVSIGDGVVYLTHTPGEGAAARRDAGGAGGALRRGAGDASAALGLGGTTAGGLPGGMTGDDDAYYHAHYAEAYAVTGRPYDDLAPAYRYGYERGGHASYVGRAYGDAEADLRRDYETHHGASAWEQVKDAVRVGYERVRRAVT